MKNILIIPGITDLNRGDQALVWFTKDILDTALPSLDIRVLECGNTKEEVSMQSSQSIRQGMQVLAPLLLHPSRITNKQKIGYSFLQFLLWALVSITDLIKSSMLLSRMQAVNQIGYHFLNERQKETYRFFLSLDTLVVKGGGFLHSYGRWSDMYYLYYSLFNIMLAKRLKKKIIFMPNSFGPYYKNREKHFVQSVLRGCGLIYARESISQNYLSALVNDLQMAPDLAFYMPGFILHQPCKHDLSQFNNKVAITLRPYRFPESEEDAVQKYNTYLTAITDTVVYFIENGYHPVFVAHTLGPSAHEDDRLAIGEVLKLLSERNINPNQFTYIDDAEMDCYEIARLYAQMMYIVGTRFHSVIFSLTALVPALAISYSGNKTTGIMKDMGLEEYVLDISNISFEQLTAKFNKLSKERLLVIDKIRSYLHLCDREKQAMINKIKDVLLSD